MIIHKKIALLTIALCGLAQAEPISVDVYISGTLIAPINCQINGNKTIDIIFGDVSISEVQKKNVTKDFTPGLICTDLVKNELRYQISGSPGSSGSGNLQTTSEGLGIKFYDSELRPVNLNEWHNFNYANGQIKNLYASLFKYGSAPLDAGAFIANAKFIVDYQ